MNISVPTQIDSSALNSTQLSGPVISDMTSLLFSLLFNNMLSMEQKAEGQTSEELQTEGLGSQNDRDQDQGVIAQSGYLQVLQNLFPAGKEANSGAIGVQSSQGSLLSGMSNITLNDLQSILADSGPQYDLFKQLAFNADKALTSTNKMPDIVTLVRDMGLEWSTNPVSGENSSLNLTELDKYIKLDEQLQVLSGKIELAAKQESQSASTQSVIRMFGDMQPVVNREQRLNLNQAKSEYGIQINQAQAAPITEVKNKDTAFANGGQQDLKGQMNEEGVTDLANHSSSKEKTTQHTELDFMQTLTNQADNAKATDKSVFPESKVYNTQNIFNQVIETLKKHDLKSKEVKELTLHLHPAELGKLQISLRVDNGQVNLVMNASDPVTGQFLQNYQNELRNSLTQSGVDCGSMEMGYQNQSQSGSDKEFSRNHRNVETVDITDDKNSLNSAVRYYGRNGAGSRINVSA